MTRSAPPPRRPSACSPGSGRGSSDVDLPDAAAAVGQPGTPGWLAVVTEESRFHHRAAWANRPADLGPDVQFMFSLPSLDGPSFAQSLALGRSYAEGVRRVLADVDVLASPTTAIVAPDIGADTVTVGGTELPVAVAALLNTAPFNIAGLPAVSVPCGLTGARLPIGLQLAGKPFDEAVVLRAAHAYEQAVDRHHYSPCEQAISTLDPVLADGLGDVGRYIPTCGGPAAPSSA